MRRLITFRQSIEVRQVGSLGAGGHVIAAFPGGELGGQGQRDDLVNRQFLSLRDSERLLREEVSVPVAGDGISVGTSPNDHGEARWRAC